MPALLTYNVYPQGRRTSVRLEAEFWEALGNICTREQCSFKELCTFIDEQRGAGSFTSALRTFALDYYRPTATEAGHEAVEHGNVSTIALSSR